MKLFSIALMAFTLSAPLAFAHPDCKCDKKCEHNCHLHKGKKCKCEHCDCAKTGHCDHDHCNMDHQKMEQPKS